MNHLLKLTITSYFWNNLSRTVCRSAYYVKQTVTIKKSVKQTRGIHFLCPHRLGPPEGIERSCPCVRPSIHPPKDQVKIFGQGRISSSINGRKLIFHMRIYLCQTSRNIQNPWAPDLYFTVNWLRTLARLSRLRFLSKVESPQDLQVDISYKNVSLWDQDKSHDLLTCISWSADFRLWLIFHG